MKLKFFILSLLLNFSESFIIRKPVNCLGGLELGTITLLSGKLMDKTISKNQLIDYKIRILNYIKMVLRPL